MYDITSESFLRLTPSFKRAKDSLKIVLEFIESEVVQKTLVTCETKFFTHFTITQKLSYGRRNALHIRIIN